MRILIVEDDYLQAQWIYEKLKEGISDAAFVRVTTELEFRSRFDEIANTRPDVAVMDVMLRWTDPSPNVTLPPEEIQREGFYRAGLRLERLLAADDRTANVPVILYTVLERADLNHELSNLPARVQHLPKHSELTPLIEKIKELTHQPRGT
jgi:CheY-like chemotaxis protein